MLAASETEHFRLPHHVYFAFRKLQGMYAVVLICQLPPSENNEMSVLARGDWGGAGKGDARIFWHQWYANLRQPPAWHRRLRLGLWRILCADFA